MAVVVGLAPQPLAGHGGADLLPEAGRWRGGTLEQRRVDGLEPRAERSDLGELGTAGGAPVEVGPHPGLLGRGEVPERERAEQLAQRLVVALPRPCPGPGPAPPLPRPLVVVHGVTPISSIAERSAFRP